MSVMDLKYSPAKARRRQARFFGKKGVSGFVGNSSRWLMATVVSCAGALALQPAQAQNAQNVQNTPALTATGWTNIYVSPSGSDHNEGTETKPLKTVAAGIRMARETRRLHLAPPDKGVQVLLEDGLYSPDAALVIRPEDGGTALSPTRIAARHSGKAVISGGLRVSGWQKANTAGRFSSTRDMLSGLTKEARAHVFVAPLPKAHGSFLNFRQVWVNGDKAIRAESINGGSHGQPMQRILSWDHEDQSCWIPKPRHFNPQEAPGMEMVIHQWWAIAVLRVRSAKVSGDSVQLHFYEPESTLQSEHPWPAPWISEKTGNSAFYLTAAPSFLDAPGEWYVDRKNQLLYYWPKSDQDLSQANVIIPYLETILEVDGSTEQPVPYFQLKGIAFKYATWLRPSEKGHVPLQAGMYLLEAYKLHKPGTPGKASLENQGWIGRPPAAVALNFTRHASVEDCRFEHLASSGLDLVQGTEGSMVQGNLFKDIGGTGIQVGVYSPENYETHLAYNPRDRTEICRYDTIQNNLVTDVTNEDWGCVGISAGCVQNIYIAHNEVADVSYSGICVGWGWTKHTSALKENKIIQNKVTHYGKRMYDVGGIYTLSAQPGTLIEGNYIDSIYKAPYPHDPDHWFYFYLDEGSSYITIKNNWSPAVKVMKNANGPGNTWENNGPLVADAIRQNAGLTPAYKYLLKDKVSDDKWPIQPVVKEHVKKQ